MTILLLSRPDDGHLPFVTEHLNKQGASFIIYDKIQFPSESQISINYTSTGKIKQSLRLLGERDLHLDLSEITAVWDRRSKPAQADPKISNPIVQEYIEETSEFFLDDVWHNLDCLWLPGLPSVVNRAKHKGTQLRLAGELGFEIPPTIITNNPDEFLEFYRRHDGQIVGKTFFSKPLPGNGIKDVRNCWGTLTIPVFGPDIGFAPSIRFCPLIFQAYIPKSVELRITVVGDEIFPCEIHSQSGHRTKYDWRNYDEKNTPYYPHQLPSEVRQQCFDLVKKLGLCYGAIDLIVTPDGRYVFLEINPKGQFSWIENNTGFPISETIANLLLSRKRTNLNQGVTV